MTINQKTLLLDLSAWDLVLDVNGNIALAGAPYSVAQDVASAVRTFSGECTYDTSQGLPYWSDILGKLPPMSFVSDQIVKAAESVPNVQSATFVPTDFSNRTLSGQIQIIDTDGNVNNIGFNQ